MFLWFLGIAAIIGIAKLAGGSHHKPAVVTPVPPQKSLPPIKPKRSVPAPQTPFEQPQKPLGTGRYQVQTLDPTTHKLDLSYDGDNGMQAIEIFNQWERAKVGVVLWDRHLSTVTPAMTSTGGKQWKEGV